jgi:hypothetical protein
MVSFSEPWRFETSLFSARLDAATIPDALRAGTYLEPTRFDTSSPRPHATAGFDVHVPVAWSLFGLFDDDTTFRVGGALDSAERYFAWTASLGIWR